MALITNHNDIDFEILINKLYRMFDVLSVTYKDKVYVNRTNYWNEPTKWQIDNLCIFDHNKGECQSNTYDNDCDLNDYFDPDDDDNITYNFNTSLKTLCSLFWHINMENNEIIEKMTDTDDTDDTNKNIGKKRLTQLIKTKALTDKILSFSLVIPDAEDSNCNDLMKNIVLYEGNILIAHFEDNKRRDCHRGGNHTKVNLRQLNNIALHGVVTLYDFVSAIYKVKCHTNYILYTKYILIIY